MTVCMDGKTLLSDEEHDSIVHALGLTRWGGRGRFGQRWAYRNYFEAGPDDLSLWEQMEAKGLARRVRELKLLFPYRRFAVTWRGVVAVGAEAYTPSAVVRREP